MIETPAQSSLFGEAPEAEMPHRLPAFARGSDTSRAAAESVEKVAETLRAAVFAAVKRAGPRGMTCDEIQVALGMLPQSASARVNELTNAGALVDTGQRRWTRTHRKARVLVAVDPENPEA